jgi:SAM-dependent methyltransferase
VSFFSEIDRRLRHSVLARAQPFIRARTPWLHHALLVSRELILPFRSRYGLTRYQHRALERFHRFFPDLSGTVLEIGSDVEGIVLKELSSRGARRLLGLNIDINPEAHGGRGNGGVPTYEIVKADVRRLPFRTGSISAIVSLMAFEHVHDMDVALREMHRVLKPGGIVYSDFGPIWSCSIGHHVFAIVDGVEARHWKPGKNPVPHYAHLLAPPATLRAAVLEKSWVFPKLADAIVRWIYESDGVNRIFYEDYARLFEASPFKVKLLVPVREHVPRKVQKKLEQACPGHKDFGVRMVEVVLEKT